MAQSLLFDLLHHKLLHADKLARRLSLIAFPKILPVLGIEQNTVESKLF